MTVEELNQKINSALSLGDLLKAFIPGPVDDRILEYVTAILANNTDLQQLLVEDIFDGPELFRGGELQFAAASGEAEAIDPATIAIIIQLVTTLGPILREWIRKRREQ